MNNKNILDTSCVDIRNPFNILQSNYGGEAQFKSRPGLRSGYFFQ